ncbi:low temperature requirement protein A [Lentzea tibetensis]|uniref:Low temperature requirement protein A n=1 Tax=Lentzea tibetensis TaxID=2591470 RepID=A0A563EW70_9PSEU|nr:low temperature requirement protein A [Lentzea tibetensis]TWP51778.1 low temperature requirement protein A [Lentzea tibetensis]
MRRLVARDSAEAHRVATPLELLFDLSFVVAVAQAATSLHHAVSENHLGTGVLTYSMMFFALWWPWVNFTWFASAYDNDDVFYRLTTMVQIGGVLLVAAGIPRVFDHHDFGLVVTGYVVIRMAMVVNWVRAAHGDPRHRACATRYAVGVGVLQALWVGWLFIPEGAQLPSFFAAVVVEMLLPVWAERPSTTSWHPHHVIERHGLFTLIVLGESILAATIAFQKGADTGHNLITLAIAALVIVCSLWWIYFETPPRELATENLGRAFVWGYGHYFILGSVAAVGAGLAASVDYDLHVSHAPGMVVASATTVPIAIYLLSVWFLQVCPRVRGLPVAVLPVGAVLVLGATFAPAPIHVAAGILVILAVAVRLVR